MSTMGYAKHPCTQSVCTLGFAVRPIRPYRHEGRTQSPFKQQIHPGDDLN